MLLKKMTRIRLPKARTRKAEVEELRARNAELEAANRRMTALYEQISEELEQTNQGVVALYAELEDRTARLHEANEAKTRFLANVSHELRAPATSILGLCRMLIDPPTGHPALGEPLDPERRHQVELIRTSGRDLLTLVNDLLDLAKAESGRMEPNLTEVDVRAVFGRLTGLLRPMVRDGVELAVEDPGAAGHLFTDEVMLTRVLRNLLTNGLKFTERGEVRLSAREEDGEVVLSVADTGIGIAADQLDKIFEEFYQVRGPLQAEVTGTGLGLPYARRLVRILGGTMSVRSTAGRGTTFEVRLPRPKVGRALIVDDDAAFRLVLLDLVKGVADTVEQAADGQEGLEAMRRSRPDVVFLDMRMPAMGGARVLEAMHDDDLLREIPVVVVTSAEVGLPPGGAVAVLQKSALSRTELLRVIGACRR
ncbi:ATP-binding protein [Planotetraspora sp. GP83]|uniref:hybrid sensor histidine kinase/response regulator n=1 Tax=Planotetraspora sp. GP83 TaxID=3156264 RepID=UPI0035179232